MYKLAGLDAGFLYNETPRCPQHIASIQVLELPQGREPAQFVSDLKRLLQSRLHLVPYFTRKLQEVPFQLDHPVWVRDTAFDIDNHVLHAAVPAPGGRAELEATVAELHARPLDRSRPLWELWVLSGLEGGRIAYYNRVHHACLDGVSGQAAVEAIMDPTPEVRAMEPPVDHVEPPSRRSPLDLLTEAFTNFASFQIRQASRVLDHAESARRLLLRSIDPSQGLGAMTERAPATRFNRLAGRERCYATGELPLADVRRIGKTVGATLNDVFLAIVSGGLRRYFLRLDELPGKSLIAGCPVSLRKPDDTTPNNQVTLMLVSFASDEPDPVKRLLKIARSSAQAKGVVADIAASYDADVALPGLPGLLAGTARLIETTGLTELAPPPLPFNMVVSNVPGPRQPLYSLGARMLTHYPVSIPVHTQAVNVTVQSYVDQLFFAITGCARALPDAALLRDDMLVAFAELQDRVLAEPTVLPPRQPVAADRVTRRGALEVESRAA